MERNVEALKRKVAKDQKMYHADKSRLTEEGVVLVDEMNNLRRENHQHLIRREAVRQAAIEAAGDPALKEHITGLEDKQRILEDMLTMARGVEGDPGTAPELPPALQ